MNRIEAAIATPCGADWRTMQPRGTARLCASCDRLVHDLSSMSEREARALLQKPPAEGLCVRYLHDAYGNIWFAGGRSDPVIPIAQLLRSRAARAAAASALALAPLLTEACGGANPNVSYDASPGLQFAMPGVASAEDAAPDLDGGTPTSPEAEAGAVTLERADAEAASSEPDGAMLSGPLSDAARE